MDRLNELDAGASEGNIFKILVATDCHLGYNERDPVRGNDSFIAFEEILSHAKEKGVDFILLGGDLFHDNKPSRKTLYTCLKLLRQYCMGNKPISIEFLSDQSENFKNSSFPTVNYEDPNLNISIPMFTIHGNHDDPAGPGNLCALDLLSIPGLINYFGKALDLEHVRISPLLMQKGCTHLALYGLGSIRDERLHRMFSQGQVETLRPRENKEDWFNIFVIHQNRAHHGPKNYIPGKFLDDYLDLIIWGHEHECKIDPVWEEWPPDHSGFFVMQPGSSVATSLCPGEAVPKHVGLLEVYQKSFKMTKIPLKTVRLFYIEDVYLSETGYDILDPDIQKKVIEYCSEKVDVLLDRALGERSGHPKQPTKPLIRLRVEHRDINEIFSSQRFGQKYVDKVANSKDIIHFHKKAVKTKTEPAVDFDQLYNILDAEIATRTRVVDLVKEYFQSTEEKTQLSLLSETGMGNAIQEFVEKDGRTAIVDLTRHQMEKVQKHLKSMNLEHNAIDAEIKHHAEERRLNPKEEQTDVERALAQSRKNAGNGHVSDRDDDDGLGETSVQKGRGRGGRGSRGGGRSRNVNDLEDDGPGETSVRKGRGRGGRGSRGGGRGQSSSRNDDADDNPRPSRRGRGATSSRARANSKNTTIVDAFQNQGRKAGSSTSRGQRMVYEVSDSEEEDKQPRKRQRPSTSRGIAFDSGEDTE